MEIIRIGAAGIACVLVAIFMKQQSRNTRFI